MTSLTDRTIAALPIPSTGQKFYSDGSIPGFGVRVSRGGTKTFVLHVGSDRRRITVGRYGIVTLAQARQKARTILARRQLGLDVPITPTLGEGIDLFLSSRSVRPSTLNRDRRVLDRFSSLHNKRIADLAPETIQAIIDRVKAPTTKDETVQRISNLMRFLEKRGEIPHWPSERLHGRRKPVYRERVLSTAELGKILATARIWRLAGNPYGTIIELLVLTGQRRGQIGSLERRHIDFEHETISWPPELMKNARRHTIPLSPTARVILEPRAPGLLFPNQHSNPFTFCSIFDKRFRDACGVHDWVLHDVRRTLATGFQSLGIPVEVTEALLSHRSIFKGVTGIYQRHTYITEMRSALLMWEAWLQGILSTVEATHGQQHPRTDTSIHHRAA